MKVFTLIFNYSVDPERIMLQSIFYIHLFRLLPLFSICIITRKKRLTFITLLVMSRFFRSVVALTTHQRPDLT